MKNRDSCENALGPIDPADPVVHVVAQDRRGGQEWNQDREPERPRRRQRSAREQERVAREERGHDDSRFHEDDQEEETVGRRAVRLHEFREVAVEVQEDVDEPVEHGRVSRRRASPGV